MSWDTIFLEQIPLLLNRFLVVVVFVVPPSSFEHQLTMFRVFLDIFFLLLCYLLELCLQFCETAPFRSRRFRNGFQFRDIIFEVFKQSCISGQIGM